MTDTFRLTRALVDRLPPRVEEEGPVRFPSHEPEWYAAAATRLLAERAEAGLWVFAAGSLIWNPRFEVAERRPAIAQGWRRAFCLGPMMRFRGSPSAPGLMMSLCAGGTAPGVVLRMAGDDLAPALAALMMTEPPTPPQWLTADTDHGPLRALAFTVNPGDAMYCPEPPESEVADMLASAVGRSGTMAEYLLNTITELHKAGVHDPYLWRLQDMVADRLARLPEPAN